LCITSRTTSTARSCREQTQRQESVHNPQDPLVALAELLDGGMSAMLLVAIRDGGSAVGEPAFEHGLRVLIDGTAGALAAAMTRRR
jgi:TetR/AcrR family transcriptional regulator, tetracycline repressor protein